MPAANFWPRPSTLHKVGGRRNMGPLPIRSKNPSRRQVSGRNLKRCPLLTLASTLDLFEGRGLANDGFSTIPFRRQFSGRNPDRFLPLTWPQPPASPGEPASLPEETFKVLPTNSLERICRKKLSKVLPTNSIDPPGNFCGPVS